MTSFESSNWCFFLSAVTNRIHVLPQALDIESLQKDKALSPEFLLFLSYRLFFVLFWLVGFFSTGSPLQIYCIYLCKTCQNPCSASPLLAAFMKNFLELIALLLSDLSMLCVLCWGLENDTFHCSAFIFLQITHCQQCFVLYYTVGSSRADPCTALS